MATSGTATMTDRLNRAGNTSVWLTFLAFVAFLAAVAAFWFVARHTRRAAELEAEYALAQVRRQ